VEDTPKADDPLFARVTNVIIADNQIACDAAAATARLRGYQVNMLSTQIQGEARDIGRELGRTVVAAKGEKICWLGGGEPTVKLKGTGKGGRAQELVLVAALEIAGNTDVVAFSAGTDGTDGPTDAAGAIADNRTVARAQALGLEPPAFLDNNDAYHFFAAIDDLVITGPTNTNVNDLMIFLK
jgi:hydroxypyruvate reductase